MIPQIIVIFNEMIYLWSSESNGELKNDKRKNSKIRRKTNLDDTQNCILLMLMVVLLDNLLHINGVNEILKDVLGNLLIIKDVDLGPQDQVTQDLLEGD